MTKTSAMLKIGGYALGASMIASLGAMVVAMCIFGFRFAEWAEWQGRIAGIGGTIAGIAGAIVGLKLALRREQSAVE